MASEKHLVIGLMSGTSLDGVDTVLADFSGPRCQVLRHHALGFDPDLRSELLDSFSQSLERIGLLDPFQVRGIVAQADKSVALLIQRDGQQLFVPVRVG